MKFTELDPQFIQLARTSESPEKWSYHYVNILSAADGVIFLCPIHFKKNNGPCGTHSIICWFKGRNIPDELNPGPGRWDVSGDLVNLTLNPSIDLGNDDWHGWIKNGEVT